MRLSLISLTAFLASVTSAGGIASSIEAEATSAVHNLKSLGKNIESDIPTNIASDIKTLVPSKLRSDVPTNTAEAESILKHLTSKYASYIDTPQYTSVVNHLPSSLQAMATSIENQVNSQLSVNNGKGGGSPVTAGGSPSGTPSAISNSQGAAPVATPGFGLGVAGIAIAGVFGAAVAL